MTIQQLLKIPFLFLFFALLLAGCKQDTPSRIYQQHSNYGFEDTLINLDIAISEHNYRIIHRSNIGQAVRDRGEKDYPLSTVISFCNITYAKEMMEINSDLINDMPCIITVREEKQGVIIGTKLMITNTENKRQNDFAKRINDNLRSIVEATIE
ncbi:MAG: DUF302 domain-containing protein [Gammaproteobacteria bacterium]|nr:MAG: DUF302 domain-containing protein [Gammaproteobacteria bacterium]RKZ94106.1 MAG: DUF302 domain-containing protein [Gammaproteobacteria bacterium]RLA01483.1 MAG: DUF302 domain-containing protein [Gammaproteobacteria bacterium]